MDVTVKINGFCASGNHINLIATVGGKSRDFTLNKSDFQLEPEDYETALVIILRNFVKESGLTNWSQIKTAVEGKIFKL